MPMSETMHAPARGGRKKYWTRERIVGAVRRWADAYGEPPTPVDFNPTQARQRGQVERAARWDALKPLPPAKTVRETFGDWQQAMRAAGFEYSQPTPGPRAQWTPERILAALRDWQDTYGEPPRRIDWDRSLARCHGRLEKIARYDAHPRPLPCGATVCSAFGTWDAALAAAGFNVGNEAWRRNSDAELDRTVDLYLEHGSARRVGQLLGLSESAVRARLKRAEVPLRLPAAVEAQLLDQAQAQLATNPTLTLTELSQICDLPVTRLSDGLAGRGVTLRRGRRPDRARRAEALRLLAEGYTQAEAAEAVRASKNTIAAWASTLTDTEREHARAARRRRRDRKRCRQG